MLLKTKLIYFAATITMLSLVVPCPLSSKTPAITEEFGEVPETATKGPLWHNELNHQAVLMATIDDGNLLVVTDSVGAVLCDAVTGATIWSLPDLGGLTGARWVPVPNRPLGCLLAGKTNSVYNRAARKNFDTYYNTLDMIDYRRGVVLWNSQRFGYKSVHGFFFLPPIDGLLLYGRDSAMHTWSTAVSIESGEILWRQDSLFGADGADLISGFPETDHVINGQQSPILDTDSTMIISVEQKFIRKVNIRTGTEIWRVKTRSNDVPSLVDGYAAAVYDSSRRAVYIPQGKMILGLRIDSGQPVWDTLPKLRGRAYQMQLVEQGLIVWGGPDPTKPSGHDYLTLVDLNTGKEIWSKPFTGLDHLKTSNFVVHQEQVWTFSKGKFWSVNLADGAATMTTNVLEFGDDEFWPSLEFRDSAFLVTGTNTIARVNVDGLPLFAAMFKAPPPQFGMADVLTIVVVAASVASVVAAATSPNGGYYYYPTSIQSPPSPQATTRKSNYVYILTNVRDDTNRKPGLVKVNRWTRSPEAAVKLDDRNPRYATDQNTNRLFYAREGHLVECYEF